MHRRLQIHKITTKNINQLKYGNNIKIFAKNKNELETLIRTITIYSQDIVMEFGIEKCDKLMMKSGKRETIGRTELPN